MPQFSKKPHNKLPSKFANDQSFLEKIEEQFKSKLPKRVDTISPEEYEEKEDKAYIARIVLDRQERGKHLILFIESELKVAEEAVLNNTIRDVAQEGFVQNVASRLLFSRKEQIQELSGKYQALKGIKETLQFWIDDFAVLEQAIEDGKVIIEDYNPSKPSKSKERNAKTK